MANNKLQQMLDISNRMEKASSGNKRNTVNVRTANPQKIDEMIQRMDEQVYGKYEKPKEEYDPNEEMESIRKRISEGVKPNIINSKMPQGIIQSLIENPLDINPSIVEDPKMTKLQQRLAESSGLSRIASINKQVAQKDREIIEEKKITQSRNNVEGGAIDYSLIKLMIENAIDEKLKSLNESAFGNKNSSDNGVSVMAFKNGTFKFLTENGDVYECQMVYKGKNKKR